MISGNISLIESMELIKNKTDNIIKANESSVLLKDDIWGKDTLILKSGVYLTEEIINKLLKFGIKKVNVVLDNMETENSTINEDIRYAKPVIANQNVLIVEKTMLNASMLVKKLLKTGFKEGNIFVTLETGSINKYFRTRHINFLFIDEDLYDSCQKCVEKFSLLRDTHAYIMVNMEGILKFKRKGISEIEFITKPVVQEKLNLTVLTAINHHLSDFYAEEVLIS